MSEETGTKIAIVTDSTSDLPRELAKEHGIRIIPQILIMGTKTWRDGVDIDPPAFYELLRTSPDFPASSQPSVTDFEEVFAELAEDADGIAAILVSDELSGTLNAARMAKESLPDVPIEIVDTRAVSAQLAFFALEAARAAAAGGDLQTVADAARAMIGNVHIYFVVDTLEYLHRGGRIGTAARLFGTALNLKPLLTVKDGIVQPVTNVRSRRKALANLFQLLDEQLAGKEGIHMAVLHISAPEEASQLAEQMMDRFHPVEMIHGECGPVVGAHVGPGTLGIAYYVE